MDAATQSKRARTTTAAAVDSPAGTPQKLNNSPVATLFAEQVATPENSMERRPMLRRAAGNDAVALSVNEAQRAALGLRRPDKGRVEEDALESVDQKLGVGAGAGRLPVKRKPDVRLPERYETLCELFNGFESSTRLLRVKGTRATFPIICLVIQILADRKFTYRNLAQLKYIMPEAIVINKILLHDEKTCCMKPDLQVNLLVDAVVGSVMQKGESRYMALRKIFRQRLVDFFTNHPEGDDIPEHELPHPFTQTKPGIAKITPRVLCEAESVMPPPCLAKQQPVAVSHMAYSFKRIFSKRASTSSSTDSITSPMENGECTTSSTLSRKSEESHVQDKCGKDVGLGVGGSEWTPVKFASTPVRLMAATPGLQTPKSPMSATLCDTPPRTIVKRSARTKLFMTPTKNASIMEEENHCQSDIRQRLNGV